MITLSYGCAPKPPVVAARARAHLLQTSVTPGLLQTSVARTFVSCLLYYIYIHIHIHALQTGLRAHWGRTIMRLFGAHVAYADVAIDCVWSVAGM